MSDAYDGITDNRLTPEDFHDRYGDVAAMSLWGARWVGSAILVKGHKYVRFDHATGDYVTEQR